MHEWMVDNGFTPHIVVDAERDGDTFYVYFDLPGVDPDSIDLTVERNVLQVSAERKRHPRDGA